VEHCEVWWNSVRFSARNVRFVAGSVRFGGKV